MEPVIGITCSLDRGVRIRAGAEYVYLRRDYATELRKAGAAPVLVTPDLSPDACARLCHGLVITGGDDLPRSFDGEAATWDEGAVREDAERIAWERALLDRFGRTERPVLGVCYGMQLMNVHWGGSLTWCDESAHGGQGAVTHHDVQLLRDVLPLGRAGDLLRINSSHRQAIDRVATNAVVLARAADGTVEALERGACWGVQWHPETDPSGSAVYGRFTAACRAGS